MPPISPAGITISVSRHQQQQPISNSTTTTTTPRSTPPWIPTDLLPIVSILAVLIAAAGVCALVLLLSYKLCHRRRVRERATTAQQRQHTKRNGIASYSPLAVSSPGRAAPQPHRPPVLLHHRRRQLLQYTRSTPPPSPSEPLPRQSPSKVPSTAASTRLSRATKPTTWPYFGGGGGESSTAPSSHEADQPSSTSASSGPGENWDRAVDPETTSTSSDEYVVVRNHLAGPYRPIVVVASDERADCAESVRGSLHGSHSE